MQIGKSINIHSLSLPVHPTQPLFIYLCQRSHGAHLGCVFTKYVVLLPHHILPPLLGPNIRKQNKTKKHSLELYRCHCHCPSFRFKTCLVHITHFCDERGYTVA